MECRQRLHPLVVVFKEQRSSPLCEVSGDMWICIPISSQKTILTLKRLLWKERKKEKDGENHFFWKTLFFTSTVSGPPGCFCLMPSKNWSRCRLFAHGLLTDADGLLTFFGVVFWKCKNCTNLFCFQQGAPWTQGTSLSSCKHGRTIRFLNRASQTLLTTRDWIFLLPEKLQYIIHRTIVFYVYKLFGFRILFLKGPRKYIYTRILCYAF